MYSLKYYELVDKESDRFTNMKIDEVISTPYQQTMQNIDEEEHTSIKYLGSSTSSNYYRYLIEHEEKENINGVYRKEPIYYYIAHEEIEVFKRNGGSSIFIKGSQKEKETALKKLSKGGIIKVKEYVINLMELACNIQNVFITGGWFGGLRIDKVSTAGIFGPDVNDSAMWSEFEKQGSLKALAIQINTNNGPLSVQIGEKGNILYYRTWKETESLNQAEQIINNIKQYFIYEGEPL